MGACGFAIGSGSGGQGSTLGVKLQFFWFTYPSTSYCIRDLYALEISLWRFMGGGVFLQGLGGRVWGPILWGEGVYMTMYYD